MDFSYLVKCDTKEEMELIKKGLELEHEFLIKTIDDKDIADVEKAEYWGKLIVVKGILEKLRKEF